MDYFNTPYLIYDPTGLQITHTDKEVITVSETGTIVIEFRPKFIYPDVEIRYDITPEMLKNPQSGAMYR